MSSIETAVPTNSAEWDAALKAAFEILLGGKQVADDTGHYGVYHTSDPLDECLFPNTWATPESLTDSDPRDLPNFEYPPLDADIPPGTWRFDLSDSLFRFTSFLVDGAGPWEEEKLGPSPFSAVADDLRAVSVNPSGHDVLVRGADLGPLLQRHGIDLADESAGRLNAWLTVLLRIVTDGTLADGMRAATFTGNGPEHLMPMEDWQERMVDRDWREPLGRIAYPALRDHLRLLCLDERFSRSSNASYMSTGFWPHTTGTLKPTGYSLTASWQYGENQAGTVVVRLP